jgi:heat shock protein HslJ
MSIRTSVTAALAALALVSSTPVFAQEGTPTASPDLTSFVWELIEVQTGPNASDKPVDPSKYTVSFHDDGTVTIVADCNTALGTYTIDGSDMDVEVGPMTLVMCSEDSLSNKWIDDIDQAVSFSINDRGELSLNLPMDGGFVRLQPSLTGVVWEWTQLQHMDESTVVPDDPSRYTIEFLADGTMAIGADCNRGRGTYTRDGDNIEITVTALTRAMCAPDSLSNDFLGYIGNVNFLSFFDGALHLTQPREAGILTFTPQALAPVASPEAGQ